MSNRGYARPLCAAFALITVCACGGRVALPQEQVSDAETPDDAAYAPDADSPRDATTPPSDAVVRDAARSLDATDGGVDVAMDAGVDVAMDVADVADVGIDAAPPADAADASVARVVFYLEGYLGAFGGVSGADQLCAAAASSAALPGNYKAWISDALSSPANRFSRGGPYILRDGTIIAQDWTELTSGHLRHPINLDATGRLNAGDQYRYVWTNTAIDGTSFGGSDCLDWSSSTGTGTLGDAFSVTAEWTVSPNPAFPACNYGHSLYCFQQ